MQPFESGPDDTRLPTLEEDFTYSLKALKEGGAITNLRVLEEHHGTFKGHLSLRTKIRYLEYGMTWIDEAQTIEYPRGVTFSVGLHCRPEEVATLEPFFERIAASVKLHCDDAETAAPARR
jgi:hypothetical protein